MKTKPQAKVRATGKRRSDGGDQAIALGPQGVSAEDSPTIIAAHRERQRLKG